MKTEEAPTLYTPPSPLAGWHRAFLWGTFVFSLLARAAYLKQLQDSPLWGETQGGLVDRSPVYAWLVDALSWLAGPGLMAPRLLQTLIGAGTCALLYMLGRQAFGPAAGLAAGLASALFAPWLHHDAAIAPDCLATFLVTAALYQCFAGNASQRGMLATSGLALGLGALFHPVVVWTAPPIVLWIILDPWIRSGRSSGRIRESAGRFAAFGVGLALVAVPVAARSYHLHGSPFASFVRAGVPVGAASTGYAGAREALSILTLLDPLTMGLLPLAVAGLVVLLSRWREGLGFCLLVAAWWLPPFLGLPGVPGLALLPLALVLTGSTLVEIGVSLASPRRIRGWLALVVVLVVYLFGPRSL